MFLWPYILVALYPRVPMSFWPYVCVTICQDQSMAWCPTFVINSLLIAKYSYNLLQISNLRPLEDISRSSTLNHSSLRCTAIIREANHQRCLNGLYFNQIPIERNKYGNFQKLRSAAHTSFILFIPIWLIFGPVRRPCTDD